MDPGVVLLPDCPVNRVDELPECFESCGISKIDLELVVERFLVAVLPRASGSRAGDQCSDSMQRFNEGTGIVLATVVAVEDCRPGVGGDRIHESRQCQLYRVSGVHRYPDDLPREQILNRCHIHCLAMKRYVGEVRHPDMVLV